MSGSKDWDRFYQDEKIWSGRPNGSLTAEVSGMSPGNALDLGCGEGADAIWLASRGWRVTAVDISEVALTRAREGATQTGVDVSWVCVDFVESPPAAGVYDLVTTHYPALLRTAVDASVGAVLTGVAPGGTLLFVSHLVADPEVPRSHGFEHDDYVDPYDVARYLDDDWTVEVLETRPRTLARTERSAHADDIVLKAVRRG